MPQTVRQAYGTNPWIVKAAPEVIKASPTIVPAAYHTGDLIGTLLTFADAAREPGGTGTICSVELADKANQGVKLELALFTTTLTGTTLTDNSAFDPADADLLTKIGSIIIDTYEYNAYSDNSSATKSQLLLAYKCVFGSADIYGVLVSRGAPTYASASDLQVSLGFLQN